MLSTLNFSVINDDIKDIVSSIDLYHYERADDKKVIAKNSLNRFRI